MWRHDVDQNPSWICSSCTGWNDKYASYFGLAGVFPEARTPIPNQFLTGSLGLIVSASAQGAQF
jgi:hypothetical protein